MEEPLLKKEPPKKLTFKVKFLYGIAEFGIFLIGVIEGFFLQSFFLEVAEISTSESGTLLLVAQFWDGICDPIVGRLSDRTNTRWGRRRPWIFCGAIPLAIAYWALWQVPSTIIEQIDNTIYYAVILLLLNTASAMVAVPYAALTAELTSNYDERTVLTTFRSVSGLLGGILGSSVHSIIIDMFPVEGGYDEIKGYLVSASVFAPIILLSILITFFGVKEPNSIKPDNSKYTFKESLKEFFYGLKDTFTNKPLVLVLIMYLFSWLIINFLQNNIYLWVKYCLKEEASFSYLLLTIQLSAAISLIFFQKLSEKIGKKATFLIGSLIFLAPLSAIYFIPENGIIYAYVCAFFSGIGVATCMLIPFSMLPDVIDLDKLRTGKRREGDIFSLFLLCQKLALGIALAGSSYGLGWAGYENPDSQAEEGQVDSQPFAVLVTLKAMVGFVPAFFLVLSLIALIFYPITKKEHDKILEKLEFTTKMED